VRQNQTPEIFFMKKHYTIYTAGQVIVSIEIILCIVATLSVLLVNGTGSFTPDHLSLLLLMAITVCSAFLLKAGKRLYRKAVLWLAILPLFFIGYEAVISFGVWHHA
jgi:hypothetical protein